MIRVITYGTYDVLHYGHIQLLKRAKALGDYLVVGVTSDDYDRSRGKINNKNTLMERIAAVEATGIADEIIVEEYEGQKIDDIRRMNIDIFTVGSDWEGKFDYLKEYCRVIYLPRTEGISSTDIRSRERKIRIGIKGSADFRAKFIAESRFVNGTEIAGVCGDEWDTTSGMIDGVYYTRDYGELLERSDAVYVVSSPERHFRDAKEALTAGKHVICESPVALTVRECDELFEIADRNRVILMEAVKTAYSTAYQRVVLLAKGGMIGNVISVDSVCTSLKDNLAGVKDSLERKWSSMEGWAPTALLPVFQILGTKSVSRTIITKFVDRALNKDAFTKIDLTYPGAVASVKVAKGAKSEGELVISGTGGYIYVPAPWWKTDYFEVRFENPGDNRRFFYQLDGEGIRHEIVAFARAIESRNSALLISREITREIAGVFGDFRAGKDMTVLE